MKSFVPFVSHYQHGKTGPTNGVLGWKRFSYAEMIPGIMFGVAALVNLGIAVPWFIILVIMLFKDFSLWLLFSLPLASLYLWFTYDLIAHFFYWLGVQQSNPSQKANLKLGDYRISILECANRRWLCRLTS